ncbi:hypothetical protein [Streptomyces violaceusniger]|uniref:hypothetical protein n=1 Tax=Streptomyces violaceusniger TaxID=68280 RepID=UPI00367730DF
MESCHHGRWSHRRHQLAQLLKPHSHESARKADSALEPSAEGMRALWLSLAALVHTDPAPGPGAQDPHHLLAHHTG